jgi:hypothetical protein
MPTSQFLIGLAERYEGYTRAAFWWTGCKWGDYVLAKSYETREEADRDAVTLQLQTDQKVFVIP